MVNVPHLTTAEVAKRLKRSTTTVHRLVESGDLTPAVRFPGPRGAMLFKPADVSRLARARAKAAEKRAS